MFMIIFMVTIFHFIYESILLPMFMVELRYSLFKLRDELRNIIFEEKLNENMEVYNMLDDAICTTINRLPYFNISTKLTTSREYQNNGKFKEHDEHSRDILQKCDNMRLQTINDKLIKISLLAIIFNSGGWIYIINLFNYINKSYSVNK